LLAGSATVAPEAESALESIITIVVGPRASRAPFTPSVAIDTGVAGIHEPGVAYRMDEVPLTLRPPLQHPRSTTDVLLALRDAIRRELRGQST
jgi:formylmethanofuran dehydrogenase subunit B